MITAPVNRAEYLKRAELLAVRSAEDVRERWGGDAIDSSQSSPLVDQDDAEDEAARQLQQLSQPGAIDTALIVGIEPDLEGLVVELPYDGRYGATAVDMLVIRSRVDLGSGTTELEGWVLL